MPPWPLPRTATALYVKKLNKKLMWGEDTLHYIMSIKNQGPWGKLRTSIKLHADSLLALNNVRWSTLTIWRRAAVTTTDWFSSIVYTTTVYTVRQQIGHVDYIRHLISFVKAILLLLDSQRYYSRPFKVHYTVRNDHPFYSIILALNRFTFYVTNFKLTFVYRGYWRVTFNVIHDLYRLPKQFNNI